MDFMYGVKNLNPHTPLLTAPPPHPHLYAKALTPSVTVFGNGACEGLIKVM